MMNPYSTDKENDHPNIPKRVFKVKEEDFSSIGKHYVLDGERVRVKSIHYRDESKMPVAVGENAKPKVINLEEIDEKEIERLQYLEKMDVINEEQSNILESIRKLRRPKQSCLNAQNRNLRQQPLNNHYFIPEQACQGQNFPEEESINYGYNGGNYTYY